MSVPSGGFSGNGAANYAPAAPSAPQAPQQGQQAPHLRVVQPTHHQGQPEPQDYRSAFDQTAKELEDLKGKYGEASRTLDVLRKKTDSQDQLLGKLRGVFVPESDPSYQAPDPVAAEIETLERELDHYIAEGFKAEKAGAPIPLTINNAIRSITGQIKTLKDTAELKKTVATLQAQLKQTNDPNRQLDGQAYQHIDGFLVRALDTLYGPGDEHLPAKNAQWTAAIQQLKAEVTSIQKEHPDLWDKVRRDPVRLQRLVNHVVTRNMPPKARQIIETERLRAEPMTEGELWKAYGEAQKIQDPRKRNQMMTAVRREILAFKFNGGDRGRGQRRRL